MLSAYGFAKYLLENSPSKKSSAEVSLYNAFRSLNAKNTPLTRNDVIGVFKSLLMFPHWRTKSAELAFCFEKYFEAYLMSDGSNHPNLYKLSLDTLQIIKVTNYRNLNLALETYFGSKYTEAKVRCIPFLGSDILVMVLKKDSKLSVFHCNNELCLMDGLLSPLREDYALHYDDKLQLDQEKEQQVLLKPFRKMKITYVENKARIMETQGYSLKNLLPKEFDSTESLPELFYHIKAIESRFIHKSSDPLYLSLTRELEQIIEKLAEAPDANKSSALECYQRGKNAFENIFTDDRLLHLLLKELAMMIASDRAKSWDEPDKESTEEWLKVQKERPLDSTNLLPIVE